jgi:hypothetical protein
MSVNNGRQRKNKKTPNVAAPPAANAPTNAVYPIVRQTKKNSMTDVAKSNGTKYPRGQCINPKPAT